MGTVWEGPPHIPGQVPSQCDVKEGREEEKTRTAETQPREQLDLQGEGPQEGLLEDSREH